ncbi:5'-methylthioadenosine/S-adenosylhomocysteine nucleosidase family protein [Aspergillus tanneri]|uniref:Nucleoside phosphorylase domain-containing protein n=1 Tax=Aspergillus tanneri TaxID=1220188 RepID=A0A5M9N0K5_9EURO|nr:uncharacterized protein ATNIH1004_001533 [Aspergillus tanneri]KAA8652628.1 hypothetical protein ATNIH1004_001533 [Aspergillus tanneri]
MRVLPVEQYTVGCICALSTEQNALICMLDEEHAELKLRQPNDSNIYTLGSMGGHNIVIGCLPKGNYGATPAAQLATDMMRTFKNIKFGLIVGIGGAAPSKEHDIRLGDIVVSVPGNGWGGVLPHDVGKKLADGRFQITGSLNKPPQILLQAVAKLEGMNERKPDMIPQLVKAMAEEHPTLNRYAYDEHRVDILYKDGKHEERPVRASRGPVIHHGLVASGNQVIKNAETRDRLMQEYKVLCIETEAAGVAAGVMDRLPSLVIRGISDYADFDENSNDNWQSYAAAVAAAYAKKLLEIVPVESTTTVGDPIFRVQFNCQNFPLVEPFIGREMDLEKIWQELKPDASIRRKMLVLKVAALKWLSQEGNSKWLLIYGNVDHHSAGGQYGSGSYDVTKFFPDSVDNGSILITTKAWGLTKDLGDPNLYLLQSLPLMKLRSYL